MHLKGIVSPYVGPNKTSLAPSDQPVVYDDRKRRFERAELSTAIKEFPAADEGWYVVLSSPAVNDEQAHPGIGSSNLPKLNFGRKVNIPGPVTFPLWPGQVANVVEGHHLRSNQYLVARVYNEEAAKANWDKSVTKPAGQEPTMVTQAAALVAVDLTMGKLVLIKGTDVSFYIPPTGIEVVPDSNGKYVREAVTLERLEYCILLSENGTKRFMEGSDVVFPNPTEIFVEKDGANKFRAIELNDDMGLYVKVIENYTDGETQHVTGEELFITGKEQKIYFPRQEHAIIKYGDQEVHYGVAIPEGEARYVLDKETGSVKTVKGPRILLPDPRKEVVVRRVIDDKTVELWYPGNKEALEHNRRLRPLVADAKAGYVADAMAKSALSNVEALGVKSLSRGLAGDDFQRGTSYTPPRTITLNNKYDGAVEARIWTGYAVMLVDKTGGRRVVVGPQTVLLDYDETLEVLELSTGKPKNTDTLQRTVYLRVHHNQVSDVVRVTTGDMVDVELKVSYRVSFEEEPEKWFGVENYVKFLCDHIRSLLKNTAKKTGVEEFYARSVDIVRDTVLSTSAEGGKRPGKVFAENGMHVYDVEVLGVQIVDEKIRLMLASSQHEAIAQSIELAKQEQRLRVTTRAEAINQEIDKAKAETEENKLNIMSSKVAKELELTLAKVNAEVKAAEEKMAAKLAEQDGLNRVSEAELGRQRASRELVIALAKQELDQKLLEVKAEVDAVVSKAGAISPQLVSALQSFSERYLAVEAAKAVSPLAIMGGTSIADVLNKVLAGTPLAGKFGNGNGEAALTR